MPDARHAAAPPPARPIEYGADGSLRLVTRQPGSRAERIDEYRRLPGGWLELRRSWWRMTV